MFEWFYQSYQTTNNDIPITFLYSFETKCFCIVSGGIGDWLLGSGSSTVSGTVARVGTVYNLTTTGCVVRRGDNTCPINYLAIGY